MSESQNDEEPPEGGVEDALADIDLPPAKGGKIKLIAMIAALAIVVTGGAGGALYFTGALDSLFGGKKGDSAVAELKLPAPLILYELPEILVDLKTGRCRSPFIKLQAVVELSQDFEGRLKEVETHVMDEIQSFTRQHQRQELVGKAGTDLLRKGFLDIINKKLEPDYAANLLFRRIILQ